MLSRNYYHVQNIYKNFLPVKIHYVNILRSCSQANKEENLRYDEVDQSYILKTLNENDTNELSRFEISKARIKKLEQWRVKRGNFESIEDVLEVDGFGIKVLEKFCKSVLDIRDNKITKKPTINRDAMKKIHNFLTPAWSDDVTQNTSEVVAIHLSVNAVSWCVVKRDGIKMTVTRWGLHDFKTENKKMHIAQILHLAMNITERIPHGDVYIFEALPNNMPNATSNQKTYIANTDKVQLLSMISILLANRTPKTDSELDIDTDLKDFGNITYENFELQLSTNGVYFLRNLLPARLYRTLVGSERTSTNSVINDIIRNSDKISSSITPAQTESGHDPIILQPLINLYKSANSLHKEMFGNALLLGLTCVRICVIQDKDTIKMISYR